MNYNLSLFGQLLQAIIVECNLIQCQIKFVWGVVNIEDISPIPRPKIREGEACAVGVPPSFMGEGSRVGV